MAFKMPGLLKSPAFQAGFVRNVNTRFDKMAENAEKYKLAAMARGQELFKEHEATKSRLKVENEAKQYIAAQFSPELADYLDSTNSLNFTVGMDTKDFFEQVDAEAAKVMGEGGVPETFTANENPYYGEQRFEEYEQSYGKVKDFMNKNNSVFGDSFELLFETNTPEMMTKEEFGVKSREDIASLNRSGLGGTEIDAMDENRLIKQVNTQGGWTSGVLKPDTQGGFYVDITDSTEKFASSIANQLASIHYRFNTDRTETGVGLSARQGIKFAKAIMASASSGDTFESAMEDNAYIMQYMLQNIKGVGASDMELENSVIATSQLYLMALGQTTKNKTLVEQVRKGLQDKYNISIPPITGLGKSSSIQSQQYKG